MSRGLLGGMVIPSLAIGLGIPKKRHKVFLSYHHANDQCYKDEFERLFGHLFINKSVGIGDIDSDVSTDYIRRIIQEDYLGDTSVLVVLIGSETLKRKHVDWEISAAISEKVGGRSGLLGIVLPSNSNYKVRDQQREVYPPRFSDNLATGYAAVIDWTDSAELIEKRINEAFERKNNENLKTDNSRLQFSNNRS